MLVTLLAVRGRGMKEMNNFYSLDPLIPVSTKTPKKIVPVWSPSILEVSWMPPHLMSIEQNNSDKGGVILYFHWKRQVQKGCHGDFRFVFLQHHLTCGILVFCPGIRPMPLALEAQSLNQWTAREAPEFRFDECAPTGVKSADVLTMP